MPLLFQQKKRREHPHRIKKKKFLPILISLFNLLCKKKKENEEEEKHNCKMNNFGLVWFGWEKWGRNASEIIRNEVFKWNISILCSTKRLTADITMIIFHRLYTHLFILTNYSTQNLMGFRFFYQLDVCPMLYFHSHNWYAPSIFPLQFRYDYYYSNSRRPCIWTRIDIVMY